MSLRFSLWVVLLAALALPACGATVTGRPRGLQALRLAAEQRPKDPDAQLELAVAELLGDGEAQRAGAPLSRALAAGGDDPRLHWASLLHFWFAGELDAAVEAGVRLLESSHRRRTEPALPEAGVALLKRINDLAVEALPARASRLQTVLDTAGWLPPAARYGVAELLIEEGFRQGASARVDARAQAIGCVRSWRSIGPFGPNPMLRFDEGLEPEADAELAHSYDLGPGRGEALTRELDTLGCATHIGGGPVAGEGIHFVETELVAEQDGQHLLRVETPNAMRVWVDAQPRLTQDLRQEILPRVAFLRLQLKAGTHRVRIKLATRHPNPVVALALLADGPLPASRVGTGRAGRGRRADPLLSVATLVAAMGRTDSAAAVESLSAWGERRSPLLRLLEGELAVANPALAQEVAQDAARRAFTAASMADGGSWFAEHRLAGLDSREGRQERVMARLAAALKRWPELSFLQVELAQAQRARGWDAAAERSLAKADGNSPCLLLVARFDLYKGRGDWASAADVAEGMLRCDARSGARLEVFESGRRWKEARAELRRLQQLSPPTLRRMWDRKAADLALQAGDRTAAADLIESLRVDHPRSMQLLVEAIDASLAAGDPAGVRSMWAQSLGRYPAEMTEVAALAPVLGLSDELDAQRKDGLAVIAAYEKSGRSYAEPKVLVLDYTVVRLLPDGTARTLTHNITRLQSREAVDAEGEFAPPGDARILQLRTVKADGTVLEPQAVQGKSSWSLPKLQPGDYVEVEYLSEEPPPAAYPDGYLSDRFYFQSFETPFDHSEFRVLAPPSTALVVDALGDAPVPHEDALGDLRVLSWVASQSPTRKSEADSVDLREFMPSVRVGFSATWEAFSARLRDELATADRRHPQARRLVTRLLRGAGSDWRARARQIYAWVVDSIDENEDVFGSAPQMVSARTGNRARVLHYLLGLAGLDAELIALPSLGHERDDAPLPEERRYDHLLVRVSDGKDSLWLYPISRAAPFAFLPPPLRGQRGLSLARAKSWMRAPEFPPETDREVTDARVELRADGGASIVVRERHHGVSALAWRNQLEGIAAAELRSRFAESVLGRRFPGATLQRLKVGNQQRSDAAFRLRYEFQLGQLGRQAGGRRLIGPLLRPELQARFAAAPARSTTQVVSAPVVLQVSVSYQLPAGARVSALPAAESFKGPNGASFSSQLRADDGVVERRWSLVLPVMRVTPTQYAAFAAFCRAVDTAVGTELEFDWPQR